MIVPSSDLRRDDYVARALCGGYPEAVRRADPGRRSRFLESYIADLINRDVRQVSAIERPADMRRLLNVAAASMAGLTVVDGISNRTGLPASTVRRYLDLLELLFVTRRVPGWSSNLTTRAVATPKITLVDSGLAGHLVGMSLKRARHPSARSARCWRTSYSANSDDNFPGRTSRSGSTTTETATGTRSTHSSNGPRANSSRSR